LEEAETEREMDKWNLKNVMLERDMENCEVYTVPAFHLIERRPPVIKGDPLQVQNSKGGKFI